MYHVPVMLQECLDGLAIKPDGVYVDVTFGGGGHSKAILEKLGPQGRLFGFDQDEDAAKNALEDERFTFVQANFSELKRFLRLYGYRKVDGILADLGVSSYQFDTAERGFSFRFESLLDMRMNKSEELTAAKILNTYNATKLQQMFSEFGEVRNARTLAEAIVAEREIKFFQTTQDFTTFLKPLVRGEAHKYFAQVFQALRIEVNQELEVLKAFLEATKELLSPEGRLVVMSYHSLEDRLVKNLLKTGNCEGNVVQDFYGHIDRPFKLITKKAVDATAKEQKENSRSRSAKLRVGEIINNE